MLDCNLGDLLMQPSDPYHEVDRPEEGHQGEELVVSHRPKRPQTISQKNDQPLSDALRANLQRRRKRSIKTEAPT